MLAPANQNKRMSGHLADNIMHFARVLREAGIPVGPGLVLDALDAAVAGPLRKREDFYWTLHAVFVKRREHKELFDQAFHVFWKKPKMLEQLMQPPFFPVPLDIMHACIAFNDFAPGDLIEPGEGIVIRTAALNHPGGAVGYRVEYGGRAACYVTDTEHVPGAPDKAVLDLIAGADLVIYDATYTDEEFERFRGWGHSTWQEGVRLCAAAGAARLVAFHHDPDHDDAALDGIDAELRAARPGSLVAREGMAIDL